MQALAASPVQKPEKSSDARKHSQSIVEQDGWRNISHTATTIILCIYIAPASGEPQRAFENIFFISHFKKTVKPVTEGLLPGEELDREAHKQPPGLLSFPVRVFTAKPKVLHGLTTQGQC